MICDLEIFTTQDLTGQRPSDARGDASRVSYGPAFDRGRWRHLRLSVCWLVHRHPGCVHWVRCHPRLRRQRHQRTVADWRLSPGCETSGTVPILRATFHDGAPVPEPPTVLLFGIAAVCIAITRTHPIRALQQILQRL